MKKSIAKEIAALVPRKVAEPPRAALDALEAICAHNDQNPDARVMPAQARKAMQDRGAKITNTGQVSEMCRQFLGRKAFFTKE